MDHPISGLIKPLDPWSAPVVEPVIIAPFVAPKDLLLITGAAGAGKSSLGLSIAMGLTIPEMGGRIAGGALIANQMEFGDRRVLILDGEDSRRRWEYRCHQFLKAADLGPESWKDRIYHTEASDSGLRRPDVGAPEISRFVAGLVEMNIGALIADTMLAVFAPSDPNSPTWVTRLVAPLRECCRRHNITLIIICHTARKTEKAKTQSHLPLGTTEQESVADALLHIEQFGGDRPGIRLTYHKSRRDDWTPCKTSVNAHFTGDGHYEAESRVRELWPLERVDQTTPGSSLPERKREYLELLIELDESGVTLANLNSLHYTKHGGRPVKASTAYDHLKWLKQQELARTAGSGSAAKWYATDKGKELL